MLIFKPVLLVCSVVSIATALPLNTVIDGPTLFIKRDEDNYFEPGSFARRDEETYFEPGSFAKRDAIVESPI
ncbi:hypothetical protein F5B20DRAFT_524036 [Whalleya microplaca]|nr:hypothetical protein F5B20DRAFT_524036 [Whalleya microplaca]